MSIPASVRLTIFVVVAAVVYVAGVSNEVYTIASPPALGLHTVIRKVESIVAFAVVALAMAWWLGKRPHLATYLVTGTALYSALIEIGQRVSGSHERLAESLFDVFCGLVAGYIVAALTACVWRRGSTA
jgi:hypothetical protein